MIKTKRVNSATFEPSLIFKFWSRVNIKHPNMWFAPSHIDWMETNLRGRFYIENYYEGIFFELNEDAMLFRMVWL